MPTLSVEHFELLTLAYGHPRQLTLYVETKNEQNIVVTFAENLKKKE